jgi:dUTP pyrophosphatase
MVVAPVSRVEFELRETLDATERGEGGHGSTGR